MISRDLRKIFLPALALLVFGAPVRTCAADSWLDRPLTNWNREGSNLPRLPRPTQDAGGSPIADRCREQIRQPASDGEKAVTRIGWMVYGPIESKESTTVFLALSSVDGMCRPLGYQAFVYSEGRYAGTLSPAAMNSRMDGSLSKIRLLSPTNLVAEFVRYSASDALCCPSRISTVQYRLKQDEVPQLVATGVKTAATRQASAPPGNSASLFGKRWVLTEMGGKQMSAAKPYIEFEEKSRRVSGDSGCNRFSGPFEMSGTSLKLSRLISTRRACLAGEANRIETSFLQALEKVTRFEAQQNVLRLFAGDNPSLVFVAK
jgi:heat shock protein HslJ